MEHNDHSRPDERSHCDDLLQCGIFTERVTPTGYEPKIIETEEDSEAVLQDLDPKIIELERNFGIDPYQIQEGLV